jgi:xylulokinase
LAEKAEQQRRFSPLDPFGHHFGCSRVIEGFDAFAPCSLRRPLWVACPAMTLIGGVDTSTQSTKVLVVDADDGRVVASGSARHEVVGGRGRYETDPAVWEQALADALAQTGMADQLDALSIGGQQHGLCVLDGDGQPLRPALLWNDLRSVGEAEALVAELGGPRGAAELLGSVPTASFTATKWAWVKANEAAVAAAARAICLPHDFLTLRLTGELITDRSDASGTAWWSPGTEAYTERVLDLSTIGLDAERLPRVVGPTEVAGQVTPTAAKRFGLKEGALVACGAGDNAGACLSLGLQPGEVAMSLGTSGTVFAVADRPSADASGTVAGFASADGRFLPLACTLNATLAVDRVAAWLGLERDAVAPSDGVVCLPWFDGERTPNVPDATGAFSGLRHDSVPGGLLQAAYEGVVATLLEAVGALDAWAPQDATRPIVLLGGGAKGPIWQSTVKRLSGRPLVIASAVEPVAYGAAIQAGAVARACSLADISAVWLRDRGAYQEPVERDDEVLERLAAWRSRLLA